jgi:hypothetical protein
MYVCVLSHTNQLNINIVTEVDSSTPLRTACVRARKDRIITYICGFVYESIHTNTHTPQWAPAHPCALSTSDSVYTHLHCLYVRFVRIPVWLRLARTIYIRWIYGIFGRGITKYTVIYTEYIRFWPILGMINQNSNRWRSPNGHWMLIHCKGGNMVLSTHLRLCRKRTP